MADATVCIFAKPPLPGRAKTRLIPVLGDELAAVCADAFLEDTVRLVERLSWAELIIAATETFERRYFPHHPVWIQPAGDLDIRIEVILRRALLSTPLALALGADSPGLPVKFMEQAREALKVHDAVLGPTEDGGFYLLGLKRCPSGLLSGIEWSSFATFSQTLARLRQHGFSVAILGRWIDVDTPASLAQLDTLLDDPKISAPRTKLLLQKLRGQRLQATVMR